MSEQPSQDPQTDDVARTRYGILNWLRIGSIIVFGLGLAIARELISGPYALGVALALSGVATFFFAPPLLAKRWKSQDRGER